MKRILYLGYDGSYVLSRSPLFVRDPKSANPFLSPRKGQCVDIGDGDIVFGHFKLKMFEVVKLVIEVQK